MMRLFSSFFIVVVTVTAFGQSGRVPVSGTPNAPENTLQNGETDPTVKQMFDEANSYTNLKFNEYAEKKIRYSDALLERTKLEQRQLAARLAATASLRKNLEGEDLYYLGLLFWIAENLDGTIEYLRKFAAIDGAAANRRQAARSVVVVALAKQNRTADAESTLAEYAKAEPKKLSEQGRMAGELAKAYQSRSEFTKMIPHAEAAFDAARSLLKDAASRPQGLDEILDAAMLVFEAHRDAGDRKRAEDSLDEMRRTGLLVQSPTIFYYAVDQKIRYLIDTGRRAAALEFFQTAVTSAGRDFPAKSQQNDAVRRLKKREPHYKLLGAVAPELPDVDRFLPGPTRSLASLRGKVILLDFWATWCGPCFDAFPSLIEWDQDHKQAGLVILGVTRYYGRDGGTQLKPDEEADFLARFRERYKLPYDFVVTNGQSSQYLYGATALPTAVLIDRKGVIRYIESGTSDQRLEQIRSMIVKLLAEK